MMLTPHRHSTEFPVAFVINLGIWVNKYLMIVPVYSRWEMSRES